MIRCAIIRGSHAALRCMAKRRHQCFSIARSNDLEPEAIQSTAKDVNIDTGPLPQRNFPISPLMDPSFVAARSKNRGPKSRPSRERTAFQKQLAKNPYALALASPVRQCNVTSLTYPRFFLQDFELLRDIKGEGPAWWLPRSLTSKYVNPEAKDGDIETFDDGERVHESESAPEKALSRPNPRSIGGKAYMLFRQDLLQTVHRNSSGYSKKIPACFTPSRVYEGQAVRQIYQKSRWRQDMHDLVLTLMRRRITESFVNIARRNKGYMVACKDWEDALGKTQIGAILWTGAQEADMKQQIPQDFATLFVGKLYPKRVPVYNLSNLLGETKLEELRNQLPELFVNQIIVMKHKQFTVELQSKLWRFQGYVAEHDTPVEDR